MLDYHCYNYDFSLSYILLRPPLISQSIVHEPYSHPFLPFFLFKRNITSETKMKCLLLRRINFQFPQWLSPLTVPLPTWCFCFFHGRWKSVREGKFCSFGLRSVWAWAWAWGLRALTMAACSSNRSSKSSTTNRAKSTPMSRSTMSTGISFSTNRNSNTGCNGSTSNNNNEKLHGLDCKEFGNQRDEVCLE